jgi:hypothetical protein
MKVVLTKEITRTPFWLSPVASVSIMPKRGRDLERRLPTTSMA